MGIVNSVSAVIQAPSGSPDQWAEYLNKIIDMGPRRLLASLPSGLTMTTGGCTFLADSDVKLLGKCTITSSIALVNKLTLAKASLVDACITGAESATAVPDPEDIAIEKSRLYNSYLGLPSVATLTGCVMNDSALGIISSYPTYLKGIGLERSKVFMVLNVMQYGRPEVTRWKIVDSTIHVLRVAGAHVPQIFMVNSILRAGDAALVSSAPFSIVLANEKVSGVEELLAIAQRQNPTAKFNISGRR